jgi:hypothetical protein
MYQGARRGLYRLRRLGSAAIQDPSRINGWNCSNRLCKAVNSRMVMDLSLNASTRYPMEDDSGIVHDGNTESRRIVALIGPINVEDNDDGG